MKRSSRRWIKFVSSCTVSIHPGNHNSLRRHKKILLLGSGELGKELVIALKRMGQTVIAVDHYAGAPAMQVASLVRVEPVKDEG